MCRSLWLIVMNSCKLKLNIQVSKGSAVRQQIWGEVVDFIPASAVHNMQESKSRVIIKIGPRLLKLSGKECVSAFIIFLNSQCILSYRHNHK